MKRLFLFDLDGTLVSTGGAGLRALSLAFFDLYGIRDAMRLINPSGKTDPAIFREMVQTLLGRDLNPGEGERLAERYLAHLAGEVLVPGAKGALDGVREFLDHLSARKDNVIALGTGNLERGARLKLRPHGLNDYFPTGGFGSDAEDRADVLRFGHRRAQERAGEPISAESVFVIGDTPLDIQAARRAGFRSIGVASGGSTIDVLAACSPDHVMPDMTHAFSWLERLAPEGVDA